MNHKLFFSGLQIDLTKEVELQLENALSFFYPPEIVRLGSYKELNDNTIEIKVIRSYNGAAHEGMSGFVNYQDMSILSGLALSAFEPWGEPIIGPLVPWSDGMVYAPEKTFEDLYAIQNSKMANEDIRRVDVFPSAHYVKITVEYA